MLFNNKLFNSIACLLSFTNLQLVIPGRTWILLYLGRTVYKRLWAYLALYTEIVEQLEAQVVAMQFSLCSKQKQIQDYFKSSPRAPTPTKEARAPTHIKDVSFKTVADVTKDVSLVDSLDMDDMELESIDTTIASVAASALMKETPTRFSTPKHPRPPASESLTPLTLSTSTSTATPSQPPAKKMKLNLGLSCPPSQKYY